MWLNLQLFPPLNARRGAASKKMPVLSRIATPPECDPLFVSLRQGKVGWGGQHVKKLAAMMKEQIKKNKK